MRRFIAPSLLALTLVGCATARNPEAAKSATDTFELNRPARRGGSVRAMPFAYIYKTNGDYNDNVTMRVDRATGQIISYPATTDVGRGSEPMVLTDGWLLDRRGGVGENTVFLKWTYPEYHALESTPSIDELRAAIIEGAHVTAIERLDMTTFDAQADTAAVNRLIRKNFGPYTIWE